MNIYHQNQISIICYFRFILRVNWELKKNQFLKSIDTFVGLPHRHEKFFEKKSITFINDSKATSFVSTRNALESHKNILWIVGGMHKLNDNFDLKGVRHNIIRAYIIGKNVKFFVKQIQKKIDYIISGNLDTALKNMFNDLNKKIIIQKNWLFCSALLVLHMTNLVILLKEEINLNF